MKVCTVSGRPCTRNCGESPENPALAGLCERLGFAPMREESVYQVIVDGFPWEGADGSTEWPLEQAQDLELHVTSLGYQNTRLSEVY